MAYLTFEAPRGSQDGLDMASALLQQRLGAMGQNQNMDLMYRRDPHAATALIQAQIAAQEEAANRAQQGDIAGQELGFRREALGANMQSAEAERAAAMNRTLAQLAGQRGIATDQMSHAKALQEAAQIAATQEAARQREFQGAQQRGQQQFQGNLADKQMQHSGGLAKDQMTLSREQMMNELMAKLMDQQTRRDASQDDLRGRLLGAMAEGAMSLDPAGWATAQPRIQQILGASGGGQAAAPAPAPQPLTAEGKFAAEHPELKAIWDKASTQEGGDRRSMYDFLSSMPAADLEANSAAMKKYLELRYKDIDPDDELWSTFGGYTTRKNIENARKALGYEPMNENAIFRLFGYKGRDDANSITGL